MRSPIAAGLGVLALLMAGAVYSQTAEVPPEAFAESPNPHDPAEMLSVVVNPACRIIGNYPPEPFAACKQTGAGLIAAGAPHREVYVTMCGEIFRFKSSFAYAAYYCFSKAANSSRDRGLQAIVESCETRHPDAMEARWTCIGEQTAEVLRRAAETE